MVSYKTIKKETIFEETIKKSKFISNIKEVKSEESAKEFIKSIKERYKGATHNVPAFVIGYNGEIKWASDDGEPSGTAGMPILKVLETKKITNVAIVVTRYFGGIKLGTGGLSRAYSGMALKAIEEAGIVTLEEFIKCDMEVDYKFLKLIENRRKSENYIIDNIIYGEKVILTLIYKKENDNQVLSCIRDITSNSGEIKNKGTCFLDKS